MVRDWDAGAYDRIADPQARWGRAVLDRLPLDGGERVLDAGCGTGRVTELLAARLPGGHVRCWLTDEPTRFEPGEPFETFLRTVILGAHLQRLAPEERDGFVRAVADRLAEPLIDYVRLNIVARRSGDAPRGGA